MHRPIDNMQCLWTAGEAERALAGSRVLAVSSAVYGAPPPLAQQHQTTSTSGWQ